MSEPRSNQKGRAVFIAIDHLENTPQNVKDGVYYVAGRQQVIIETAGTVADEQLHLVGVLPGGNVHTYLLHHGTLDAVVAKHGRHILNIKVQYDAQRVFDVPKQYYVHYEDFQVTCCDCGHKFGWQDFWDPDDWYDGDPDDTCICPKCQSWFCVDPIRFEAVQMFKEHCKKKGVSCEREPSQSSAGS